MSIFIYQFGYKRGCRALNKNVLNIFRLFINNRLFLNQAVPACQIDSLQFTPKISSSFLGKKNIVHCFSYNSVFKITKLLVRNMTSSHDPFQPQEPRAASETFQHFYLQESTSGEMIATVLKT
jgi:hypothetical protein